MKEIENFIKELEKEGLIEARIQVNDKKVIYRNGKFIIIKSLSKIMFLYLALAMIILLPVAYVIMFKKNLNFSKQHNIYKNVKQVIPKQQQVLKEEQVVEDKQHKKELVKLQPENKLDSDFSIEPLPSAPLQPIPKSDSKFSIEPLPSKPLLKDNSDFYSKYINYAVFSMPEAGIWRLYFIKSNGERELLIKELSEDQKYPSVSNDGNILVFQKNIGQYAKICIYSLKEKKPIECEIRGIMPTVSPDGSKIVFKPLNSKTIIKIADINLYNEENIDLAELENLIAEVNYPTFMYDNKKIAFIGMHSERYYGNVYVYDYENKKIEIIANGTGTRPYEYVTCSPYKDVILAVANHKIYFINYKNYKDSFPEPIIQEGLFPKFSHDGKNIIYLDRNKNLKIYNLGG